MNIIPLILVGGKGTRLWPVSRSAFPKQFCQLLPSHKDLTPFQQTLNRVNDPFFADPIILGNAEHRFLLSEQAQKANIKPQQIILEPMSNNTAPAILAATMLLASKYEEDILLLVLPSDHLLEPKEQFIEAVQQAEKVAEQGYIITFGIHPTAPETGYGYIKQGQGISDTNLYKVDCFVEKPDLETATSYLQQGNYVWNSGMFMFQAKTMLEEAQKHQQQLFESCQKVVNQAYEQYQYTFFDEESYSQPEATSIDYAIMEHTAKGAIMPLALTWSDIGNWDAVWEEYPKDENNNAIAGPVIATKSSNNLIRTTNIPIVIHGVNDIIVIQTDDVLLVCDRHEVQFVKDLVNQLNESGYNHLTENQRTVYRPWGNYRTIYKGDRYHVKRLEVTPSKRLSLQSHMHRAEHWVVVSGTAKITIDEKESLLFENQSTYIPFGAVHRLENPGKIPLVIIEVQSGAYLDEDDIQRYSDDYHRN